MATDRNGHGSLSRRDFLKTTSIAASIGALTASRHAFAEVLGERASPIIGRGELQYEVDHQWAKLPPGKQFGYTHGVIEDSRGRIYIANQSRDAIVVFDSEGHFVTSWGADYEKGAHGLTIAREGGEEVLYLANTSQAQVVKTTLEGEVIWKAGPPPLASVYSEGQKYSPTETAVAPNGDVYVADGYGQSWVHVYSREGSYLHSFGGRGEGPHSLNQPHGISIDYRSNAPVVQIADRKNVRIVNFSLEGAFLEEIISSGDLRFPCSTFHDADDLLYIPDLFSRVSIFDRKNQKIVDLGDYVDGQALTSWDDFGDMYPDMAGYPNLPHSKRFAGKFISPHGLWVDSKGNIYVVEWIEDGRVTKLTRQ